MSKITWKPERKTENSSLGNHPSWEVAPMITKNSTTILIQCTCHSGEKQDKRWIKRSQIISLEE